MDINYVLVIHDKLKMRPATIPLVLRVVSRPLRCCVQCDVYAVHQKIKSEVILTFEHSVVCDLTKDFSTLPL